MKRRSRNVRPVPIAPPTNTVPTASAKKFRATERAGKSKTTLASPLRDAARVTANAAKTKNASTTSAKNSAAAKALNTARAGNATCRRADAMMKMIVQGTTNASAIPVWMPVRRIRVPVKHQHAIVLTTSLLVIVQKHLAVPDTSAR